MKILMTGFDPFGGESINPAFEAVKKMPEKIKGVQIIKKEIPTVFQKSIQVLEEAINTYEPDWVICVGQAGGRDKISVEKVAINYDQARIADNEGNQPLNSPIVPGAPTAYFSSLPVQAIAKNWQDHKIPGEISYTAGTFVCNHIFYGLMNLISKNHPNIRGGFIHVPFLPEQTLDKKNMPHMSLEMMTKALELAVESIIQYPDDLSEATEGGTIA